MEIEAEIWTRGTKLCVVREKELTELGGVGGMKRKKNLRQNPEEDLQSR